MKTIHNKKWYKPREIAKLGLITSSAGDEGSISGNYKYIMNLINTGKLKAKDYSTTGKRPFWLVPEDEIERYHATLTKVKNAN